MRTRLLWQWTMQIHLYLFALDVHCLVHWTKEEKATVVRMSSVVDRTMVRDSCGVKIGPKVYSDAKILAIGMQYLYH